MFTRKCNWWFLQLFTFLLLHLRLMHKYNLYKENHLMYSSHMGKNHFLLPFSDNILGNNTVLLHMALGLSHCIIQIVYITFLTKSFHNLYKRIREHDSVIFCMGKVGQKKQVLEDIQISKNKQVSGDGQSLCRWI